MYKEIIKPTLVLVIIAAIISGLLAVTYNVTGVGELGNSISADKLETYSQLAIPGSTKLVKTKASVDDPHFVGVYKDEGGKGVAIHVSVKGYGKDPLMLLVGIDKDGAVTGVAVTQSLETNGLGSKATEQDFIKNFVGKSKSVDVQKKDGEINAIAGATISSKAMGNGVNSALEFYELVKGELV